MAPKTDASDLAPARTGPSDSARERARRDFEKAGRALGASRNGSEPAEGSGPAGPDLVAALAPDLVAAAERGALEPGQAPDELPSVWGDDDGDEAEHPAEAGLEDEDGAAEDEVTEGESEEDGSAGLSDRARAYLRLKVPGVTDEVIDAHPNPSAWYEAVREREAGIDRLHRDHAELQHRLQDGEEAASKAGAPSAVPAGDSLDLTPPAEVLEALGLEAGGDGAKALEGWLRKAVGPLAEQAAQTRESMQQAAERSIAAQRDRLAAAAPHLASSDAAWAAVRGRAQELAADLQAQGKTADGSALFDQAFQEITGAAVPTGEAPAPKEKPRGGRKAAAKAASAPTSASRRSAPGKGLTPKAIHRQVFEYTRQHPHDVEGAKALNYRLRVEAGLERPL